VFHFQIEKGSEPYFNFFWYVWYRMLHLENINAPSKLLWFKVSLRGVYGKVDFTQMWYLWKRKRKTAGILESKKQEKETGFIFFQGKPHHIDHIN